MLLNILIKSRKCRASQWHAVIISLLGFLHLTGCGNKSELYLPKNEPFAQSQETEKQTFEEKQEQIKAKLDKEKRARQKMQPQTQPQSSELQSSR